MYDVIIIGAGVTGCAVASELAKKERSILVIDKASDVCEGTSKANSAIIHAGHDAHNGTLKARLNVRGNELVGKLAEELDFPFKRNGSLILCFEERRMRELHALKARGDRNGVPGLKVLNREEALAMEPNLSDAVAGALYAPTGGIVCPFNMTIAFAENAAVNGVEFSLDTEVQTIAKIDGGYQVTTSKGSYEAKIVINAAGVYADVFHNMVSERKIKITPKKGEYVLMDKSVGNLVSATLFQLPNAKGKGVLVTPTVHGNLLVGPNSVKEPNTEGVFTTREDLNMVLETAALSVKSLPNRQTITSFAGLRAHEAEGDFIIAECEDAPGFVDCAGIESPGLSCAPAIGEYVAEIVNGIAPAEDKTDFIATRKGIPSMHLASFEEKQALIEKNPAYANVICRCEMVTEGEIVDAIHRPLGAKTLDGIKRRTRAGMGRCQSGFCNPKVVEILARELGIDIADVTKCGKGSAFLTGVNKEGSAHEA